jgi:O-antigen/teichoic acid export membrane protein
MKAARDGGIRSYILVGAVGASVLFVLSAGLGFLINLILARVLGAKEFGQYYYVLAWVTPFTVAAAFGLDQVLIRQIAAYRAAAEWGLLHGFLSWALRWRLLATGLALVAAAALAWFSAGILKAQVSPAIWLALGLVPVLSFSNFANAGLQGFKRVIAGSAADAALAKPLLLALLISLPWWLPGSLTAREAIALTLATAIATLLLRAFCLWRTIPPETLISKPTRMCKIWIASAIPLLLIALLYELNSRAPILLLGSIVGEEATGIFALSNTLVGLAGFLLTTINLVLSPVISSLYTGGQIEKLQALLTRSARAVLLFGGIGVLSLVFLRGWILGFFGTGYVLGGSTLVILAVGQLVNLAAGSVGTLLVMTGHEKPVAVAVGLSFIANVALGALLVPSIGYVGAAIASSASTIVWNLAMVIYVVHRLGIDPTVLGVFK